MAGAGYRLFNSGDVLTAAQVNTYLQEQVVMRFADAAARTTALSGVLAEGMISYLDSTNAVEVYDGSNWVNVGNAGDITGVTAGTGISGGGTSGTVTITNDMATTITAKGDIVAGTGNATYDNLPAGSNGETLVADSTTTTGLRWQADWNVGKNKIINGDYTVNQRNFSSSTTSGAYGLDRWAFFYSSGTTTYSAQTFTPGAAPVAGYEATNFARIDATGQTGTSALALFSQAIENVRTLAGQTVTVSFWAKAGSGSPKVAVELRQDFGTGGSISAAVSTYLGQATLSQAWQRFSFTAALPSISGKTLGTNNDTKVFTNLWTSAGSDFNSRTGSLGLQNATIDFWGVQVEAGSVATPFTTASGSLGGELALCQRYYVRFGGSTFTLVGSGIAYNTSSAGLAAILPVSMRVKPASMDYGGTVRLTDEVTNYTGGTWTLGANGSSPLRAAVDYTHTSALLTQYRPYNFGSSNDANAYFGFSAEL